jgi:hypothetical protein
MLKNILLHANCFFTKGFLRSCIFDLDRGNYYFVPVDVKVVGREIYFPEGSEKLVKQLLEAEVIFTSEPGIADLFNEYQIVTNEYFDLHSIVIEITNEESFDVLSPEIFASLIIHHLAIVVQKPINKESIIFFLDSLRKVRIKSALLIFNFEIDFIEQIPKYSYLERISILGHKKKRDINRNSYMNKVEYVPNIPNKNNILFFSRELYFESHNFNNYAHKKLIINSNKEVVLSCLNEKETNVLFLINGRILIEDIKQYLSHPKYIALSQVSKDNIVVCRDCELRYVCVDNRSLKKSARMDFWYHETECNYNPFISRWSDEKGYKTLDECGVVINSSRYSIDEKKIAIINSKLWQ